MTTKQLHRLATMLAKYGHRWGENPSQRMLNWKDEYDSAKYDADGYQTKVWKAYCEQYGLDPSHNAGDCLA